MGVSGDAELAGSDLWGESVFDGVLNDGLQKQRWNSLFRDGGVDVEIHEQAFAKPDFFDAKVGAKK